MRSTVQFTDPVMGSFSPSKLLSSNNDSILSLDFDDTGHYCLTARAGNTLDVWDVRSGRHERAVPSKKYGCTLARFTHNSSTCLYASTLEDDTLRYLDLHTNQYIRYFRGHESKVLSLELSSVDDTVLSSGSDGTVRLWDLKSPNCQGLLRMNESTPLLTAIDATGLVFAVLSRALNTLSVYDLRNFDRLPFLTFRCEAPGAWTKLEFSNDGKYIMVVTDSSEHCVYDSFSGNLVSTLRGFQPLGRRTTSSASFSMDGQYIYSACADGKVAIWKMEGASAEMAPWRTIQGNQDASLLAFSPKSMLMVTADKGLTLWLPECTS